MTYKPVFFGEKDNVVEEDDRLATKPADFRAPIRAQVDVQPLIGGIATYKAIAAAVTKASRFVYLSGWTLEKGEMTGSRRWVDLLSDTAKRCEVRILISDLDPVGNPGRHEINWTTYREVMRLKESLPADRRNALQIVVSLHPLYADLNLLPVSLFKLISPEAMARLDENSKVSASRAINMPLVWRNLRKVSKGFALAPAEGRDLRVYPASHHQKFCVVDGSVAFAGGIDIATPRSNEAKWRDVDCRLAGTIVGDLEAAFVERWNRERVRFEHFLTKAQRDLQALAGPKEWQLPVPPPISALSVAAPPANPTGQRAGTCMAQMRRTVTRVQHFDDDLEPGRKSSPYVLPTLALDEVWRTYERAISVARRCIYIENQYVRESRLQDLIAARMAEIPELATIIVIPQRVEEKDKNLTPHGNALQSGIMRTLSSKFGAAKRFGAYQLRAFAPYCHSKVLIVDDKFAIIGSANANPRSFGLDSELDIAWYDETAVHVFRLQLWRGLLGISADEINKTPLEQSVAAFDSAVIRKTGPRLLFPFKGLPACNAKPKGPCEEYNPLLDVDAFRTMM
jgi:phosphatidylserine/phosphatidylglycerophosphate/cardiolipin synthase-like enzyme